MKKVLLWLFALIVLAVLGFVFQEYAMDMFFEKNTPMPSETPIVEQVEPESTTEELPDRPENPILAPDGRILSTPFNARPN